MSQNYFFVLGAGVLVLLLVFTGLVRSAVEGYEDADGFKVGKPPVELDRPRDTTAAPKGGEVIARTEAKEAAWTR